MMATRAEPSDPPGQITLRAMSWTDIERVEQIEQRLFGPRIGIWRILDLLDRYGIKATMFVPGLVAKNHPDLLPAFAARTHRVVGILSFVALGGIIVIAVANNWALFVAYIGVVALAVFLHDAHTGSIGAGSALELALVQGGAQLHDLGGRLGEVDIQRVDLLHHGELGRLALPHQSPLGHQCATDTARDR